MPRAGCGPSGFREAVPLLPHADRPGGDAGHLGHVADCEAVEAHERGVVTRVVDVDKLEGEVRRVAENIAALSPQAIRLNKRVLRAFAFCAPAQR